MPGPITPEDVKKRFGDSRAKLIRMVSRWELSGNGFGQRSKDEEDFGHFGKEQLECGDNQANFLDSSTREHVLYLWHLSDKYDMLQNVLNVLSDSAAADSENFQTVSEDTGASRKRAAAEAEATAEFRGFMTDALMSMSHSSMLTELRQAEFQAMEYEEKIIGLDPGSDQRYITLYQRKLANENERIKNIQCAIDSMQRPKKKQVKKPVSVNSSDDEEKQD